MTTNSPPRLRMRAVGKRFGATVALAGVDLEARAGEVLALVGENGAGKSTLMKVLAGVVAADAGAMELDGVGYAPRSPLDARRRGVAMIHQELALAPHLSVAENVLLGVEPRRGPFVDRARLHERAHDALKQLGRGELDVRRRVDGLSTADQQLVEIARAVATEARVVVLDEPTSSLGGEDVARLFALIERMRSRGAAIVYISHVLEEIFVVAQRFSVLRDGRTVASGLCAEGSPAQLVAAMVGREVSELYPRRDVEFGEPVVRLTRVAGANLPRNASLEVRRGEVLGIAGLIGAGRTETLRTIFGLEPLVAGELRILEGEGARSPHERWRQGVGMVSEDRKREGLALERPIAENLCLPQLERLARFGWLSPARLDAAAQRWIDALHIKCAGPRQPIGALSGGNQQKVALARLLNADVDVLLLDEPTRGVDVAAKAEIYARIDEFARGGERKRAVLVVSSYLPELFGMCDSIAVMERGVLHPPRRADEIDEHDVMLQAAGGAA